MTGITHKQAIKWINRRQDGLLKGSEQSLLNEHLHSCESCRTYSNEMESLASRLDREFQAHRDANTGPSPALIEYVVAQAKKIPGSKRSSSQLRFLAGAVALIALAFAINFLISRLQNSAIASNNGVPTVTAPIILKIDPESCKTGAGNSAPPELGHDVIQSASFTDGDFSFAFWLYCDPSLKPDDPEHFSTIAGLGVYGSWRYTGKSVAGGTQDSFGFVSGIKTSTGWNGPLYRASESMGSGVDLSEQLVRRHIQEGTPLQFQIAVVSPLGEKSAIFSFNLLPTKDGIKVAGLQAGQPDRINNSLLAFASNQNGNSEIYTMHADGSGLTNITNDPAYDGFPHWSPDGKQIAFESDRDGSNQIYLMDADGSQVTRLSRGENSNGILDANIGNGFLGGNISNPWSPDGRKLIFSRNAIGDLNHQFYVMDVVTKNIVPLTRNAGKYYSPLWSPDGEHIAFILDETKGNNPILRRLYIVDSQGNHLTNITEGLPDYESVSLADYYWSTDGTSITFVTDSQSGTYKSRVFKAGPDGSRVELTSTNRQILDWWNGIAAQQDLPQKVEENSFSLVAADGSQSSLGTCQSSDRPVTYLIKRSSDGTLAFGSHCLPAGWKFYGATPDGTTIYELLRPALDPKYDSVFDLSWSPDNHFLAFMAVDEEKVEFPDLYILDAMDPSVQPLKMENSSSASWQPVVNETLVKDEPTPKPAETISADGLIAFTATGQNGDTDIFTIHPNGSGLTNLTNDPAIESNIAWSPDGTRLAFVSDPDGNDDIFVMNVDGTNRMRLTDDPGSNLAPLWSPDGQRIAYTLYDMEKNSADLFVMDSHGENRRRLTDRNISQDMLGVWAEEWSLDGKSIFYLDQSQISRVNLESGEITKVSPDSDWPSYLLVKEDSKIRFLSPCGQDSGEFCSKAKAINQDGTGEETYETMKLQRVCTSGNPGNFYYMAKWSPDLTKILFVFSCKEDGSLFYIANADGSDFRLLTDPTPLPYKEINFDWSPDSQSIVFIHGPDPSKTGLSLWIVQNVLQNLEFHPTWLDLTPSQISNLAWQPVAHESVVMEEPTPQPAPVRSKNGSIAFVSEQSGNQDIYTMRADGSQLTNLTNDSASDYGPLWSPDGQKIAFISERTGNADIFIMDLDGGNLNQLTNNPGYDGYFSWSPDGKKIVYEAGKQDINQDGQLILMDSNGSNKAVLTEPGSYYFLGWSPDSRNIVYLKQSIDTGPQDSVAVVTNIDGTERHEWNLSLDKIKWEDNQHFVGYSLSGDSENPRWVLNRFSANGDPPMQIASHSSPIIQLFKDTHVVEGGTILAYYGAKGDPAPYKSWNFFDVCGHGGDQFIPMASYIAAPDGNLSLIEIPCNTGTTWLYVDPLDGSEIRKLTDFTLGGGEQIIDLAWAPDGKAAIVTIPTGNEGKADIYRFDLEKMLSDPSVQPVRLTTDEARKYGSVWQPAP